MKDEPSRLPWRMGLGTLRTVTGVTLGLTAAGLTAAAGVAADRLSRDRRIALALDEERGMARDSAYHDEPDRQFVVLASDGVPLHVEVDEARGPDRDRAGRPTVVFSHGYCLSRRCWVFQRRALREAGYRVVLWDQRGHGLSGTGETDSYHIDQLGRDLEKVIAEVAPDGPLVLVGHSMGGMTLMALGLDHPELVRERVVGAAFVATSTGGLSTVSYGLGAAAGKAVHLFGPAAAGRLASFQGAVDGAVRAGKDVMNFVVDWGSFGSPVPMSIAELTTDMIFATRMEVISAFMPHFDRHDKREALSTFRGIETLVLNGSSDRLTPPSHSDEIVRLLPGAEHIVIEDAGHVIMLEHPEILNEQILALLRRAERAGAPSIELPESSPPVHVVDMARRRATRRASNRIRRPRT
ncbi:alpha/beta fold hydrolase [Austwickia chelonae]|uniref:alpha/beta fold hydrolase n=1 Tax=Austwickia chelonae TaxID=100225 RepID=UPI000E26BC5B|nr:alpha/beta hydrolase [Austwickia chelonae]